MEQIEALARAVFTPRSVALVGLSSDPSRPTGRPAQYLMREGFKGKIHVVNPAREQVQGLQSWPTLRDLPPRR